MFMNLLKNFLIIFILIILSVSCSKKEKVTILQEKDLESQMIELYNEAYNEFLNNIDKVHYY